MEALEERCLLSGDVVLEWNDIILAAARATSGSAISSTFDVLLKAQDKDVSGALTGCRGILNCGRSTGDGSSISATHFRVAMHAIVMVAVERYRRAKNRGEGECE